MKINSLFQLASSLCTKRQRSWTLKEKEILPTLVNSNTGVKGSPGIWVRGCYEPWVELECICIPACRLVCFCRYNYSFSLPLFRGRTVICAYSIEDIDQAFSTSKLRGYSSPFIGTRPGMVRKTNEGFLSFCHKNSTEKKKRGDGMSQPLFQR